MGPPTYTNSDKQQLKNSPKHTHARTHRPSSFGLQLGHFLKVYSDALAVKQHKVNVFQRGAGAGHKVVGDGLEDELSGGLLRESVPVGNGQMRVRKTNDKAVCDEEQTAELRLKLCQQTCLVCRPTLLHRSVELDVQWSSCRPTLLAEALGECVLPLIHKLRSTLLSRRGRQLHAHLLMSNQRCRCRDQ